MSFLKIKPRDSAKLIIITKKKLYVKNKKDLRRHTKMFT